MQVITLQTDKKKGNRKAGLENSALKKFLFLPYTVESTRTVGTRTVPVNITFIKQ
jgi:hypothetical protein